MTAPQSNGSQLALRWPIYRDIGAFLIGAFMLVWQTVFEENAQDILAIIGFAALGIAGSGVAQRFILSKVAPPAPPPEEGQQ
jgi:hypothetical protein